MTFCAVSDILRKNRESFMNRGRITNALKKGRILVADGAWGTALQARGLEGGECPNYGMSNTRNWY